VSQIDSLEYSGANNVKMSTTASATLQRKKLGEGKAEMPPGAFRTRELRPPPPYEQGMGLLQPRTPVQSMRSASCIALCDGKARKDRARPLCSLLTA